MRYVIFAGNKYSRLGGAEDCLTASNDLGLLKEQAAEWINQPYSEYLRCKNA